MIRSIFIEYIISKLVYRKKSNVEKDLFDICKKQQTYCNFNSKEWKAMRSLADDRNLVIKKADKGSYVVVWDQSDYLMEAGK